MFNICVMGTPRTRSSFFVFSLENHYNITRQYFEKYDLQNTDTYNLSQRLILSREKDPDKKFDLMFKMFRDRQKSVTNQIHNGPDFIIKFWTRCIILKLSSKEYRMDNPNYLKDPTLSRFVDDLENYKPYIITDLTDVFNLKNYSKYYYLTRNPTDIIASLEYGRHLNYYIVQGVTTKHAEDRLRLLKQDRKFNPISVDFNQPFIKFYIFEIALSKLFENYLLDNHLPYTKLNYDEIPEYVEKELPYDKDNIHPSTGIVETNFNYKELISNYSELDDFVSKYYIECVKRINELNIKFT